ncbi:MAG: hypothetical protein E2600_03750 [Chryseobacterium sp.]|nr:hypothetical protein [Chryseobacterium sp.]
MDFKKNLILILIIISCSLKTKAQQYTPEKIDQLIAISFQMADREKALQQNIKTYDIADEIGYYKGKAKSLKGQINCYLGLGEQEKALEAAEKLLNLATKENDDFHISQALIAKTLAYAYLGFFEKAYSTSDQAEKASQKISDNDDRYISLGQVYSGRSEIMNLEYQPPEKTIKYDLKSVEYYKKIRDPKKRNGWLGIQYSSLGYTYIDLDQYDQALYYNRKAYELSKIENDSINQAFGLYGIGNAYMEMNIADSSIYYYKKALPIFEKAQDIYRLQYIYEDLATIYEKMGEDKVYSYYSKKAKELSDLARKKEKIETDKIANNILEQEKLNWYKNFYILIGTIIGLIILSIFLALNYFKRYQTEKEQKERTEIDLIEKETELNNLESKVNDAFAELLELAKNNDSSFLSRFMDVYPNFYNRFTTEYPDMTSGQLKFCALLKLNFSTKEIALFSHISVRSVEMKKNRLRKQLGISSDVDLNNWMMNF